jgi:hypothetical protein
VHCQCTKNFQVILPNYRMIAGREFECEWGQRTAVTALRVEDVRLKRDVEETEARIIVKE